ncbi:TPA: hypothetical protein U0579_000592 [Streptococcus suis]|nr:hypothetical protein [Streptococcus suis]
MNNGLINTQGTHIQIAKKLFYIIIFMLILVSGAIFYFINKTSNDKFASLAYDFKSIKVLSKDGNNQWTMQTLSDYYIANVSSIDNIEVEKKVAADFENILSKKALDEYNRFVDTTFTESYLVDNVGENWKDSEEFKFLMTKVASETLSAKEYARFIWYNKNKIAITDSYKSHASKQDTEE